MMNLRNSKVRYIKIIYVACALILLPACTEKEELPEKSLEKPLVFIGLDGAEWSVMMPLIERGELPNIKKLMGSGISTGLINPGAMISPPVWTTFVTGEHPRGHGILDHVFPFDGTNPKQPVNSTLRTKPAIWNIASDAGLRSAVMGYFVSWPAEDILGTIVTGRAMQKYPFSVSPGSVEPSTFEIVSVLTDDSAKEEFLRRYYNWGYRSEQADDQSDPHFKAANLIVNRADRLLVNDEIILQSTKELQASAYDLIVVYFRSTDLVSHSFWREYDDSSFSEPADPELKHQLGDAIPESYRYVDEAIGELVRKFGDNANYIIVSDHGFQGAGKEIVLKDKRKSVITGNHMPIGILIAAGPDIRKQDELLKNYQVTTLDIMPTLVRLLGLPVATNQKGESLEWLFTGPYSRSNPVETINAYPIDEFSRPYNSAETVNQKKEMYSLRGLGYIGGDSSEGISNLDSYDFWRSGSTRIVGHISGEIVTELLYGRIADAVDIMQFALLNKPEIEKPLVHSVRKRLTSISKSKYVAKTINHKSLFRKFKHELTQLDVAADITVE